MLHAVKRARWVIEVLRSKLKIGRLGDAAVEAHRIKFKRFER